MNIIWKNTPLEIANNVMEFCGIVKYRNGVYMNQISKKDTRYVVLRTIPTKPLDPWDYRFIMYTKVRFPKKIEKYTFVITHIMGNDENKKCRHVMQIFEKYKGKRAISHIVCEIL
jgi:hypothetical protein